MNRRTLARTASGGVVMLALLASCGDDSSPPETTVPSASADDSPSVDEEVLDAFAAYWDEKITLAADGNVSDDAFAETATGVVREDEIARLTKDAEQDVLRSGEPKFKDVEATIDGDSAFVSSCLNENSWAFVVDGSPQNSDLGWKPLGRELSKVDGQWLVSGFSDRNQDQDCS